MPTIFARNKNWILISLAVLLVIFFSLAPSLFSGIKTLSVRVLSAPINALSSAGVYFHGKRALEEENAVLEKKIADLSLQIASFTELANENMRLRRLLDFEKNRHLRTVPAEVIARDPSDWVGSFVIDKGAPDGIRKGAAVCSARGLVGRVAEAGDRTSSVMLITHPNFKAGGMIRSTRTSGIVTGAGKGLVKIDYLPVDAEVMKGMEVITSGYSRSFPKGISVGEIVSVEKSKTGLYKSASIKPSADLFDQEIVLCVK